MPSARSISVPTASSANRFRTRWIAFACSRLAVTMRHQSPSLGEPLDERPDQGDLGAAEHLHHVGDRADDQEAPGRARGARRARGLLDLRHARELRAAARLARDPRQQRPHEVLGAVRVDERVARDDVHGPARSDPERARRRREMRDVAIGAVDELAAARSRRMVEPVRLERDRRGMPAQRVGLGRARACAASISTRRG